MKIQIIHSNHLLFPYVNSKATTCPIYNFYSVNMMGERLHLQPSTTLMRILNSTNYGEENTIEFDKAYAYQLMTDNDCFMQLMELLYKTTISDTVIILCDYDNYVVAPIIDSLTKFIQERYGLISYFISSIEDIDDLSFSEFSNIGFLNYQSDIERYQAMNINEDYARVVSDEKI